MTPSVSSPDDPDSGARETLAGAPHEDRYREINTLTLAPTPGVSVNGTRWRFRTPCEEGEHSAPRWQSRRTVCCASCGETHPVDQVKDAKTGGTLAAAMIRGDHD
jgi:hypothetical protein